MNRILFKDHILRKTTHILSDSLPFNA
ncbi:hypothetical protein CY0110_18017 [Crocosphaera chwakensis CCY0110]|uniref:Uncharacterized protein n=1 Tax=Crocosphaera chwakensis CCY0110 TaxID=391612 RepID=A3IIT5_9CHRO|nr:hypothetical protein CY0110_18017 [Crocosphaera chwakensis CCY0110]